MHILRNIRDALYCQLYVTSIVDVFCNDATCLKACGIANGLEYLHEMDIIHADLKGVCALSYLPIFLPTNCRVMS